MKGRQEFEYEYLLAKLAEIEEALALLDADTDPLRHSETRRLLVERSGQLIGALAAYDVRTQSLN